VVLSKEDHPERTTQKGPPGGDHLCGMAPSASAVDD
jgi:hypothetical protein